MKGALKLKNLVYLELCKKYYFGLFEEFVQINIDIEYKNKNIYLRILC